MGYGNYNAVSAEGAVSGPLTGGVEARLAGMYSDRNGYGKSLVTGTDVDDHHAYGGRATVVVAPAETASVTLSADYYNEDDHDYIVHYFGQYNPAYPLFAEAFMGGTVSTDPRDVNTDTTPTDKREIYGFAADAQIQLGAMDLRSITAYRTSDYFTASDYDHTEKQGVIINFAEDADQISQELQLSGRFAASTWVLGAYYFNENIHAFSHLPTNLAVIGFPPYFADGYKVAGNTDTEAWALFGQLDWALNDVFTLVLGGRYDHEKVKIGDVYELSLTLPYDPHRPPTDSMAANGFDAYGERVDSTIDSSVTPKIGFEYRPVNDLLVYATASKGFKSGGFTLATPLPAFKPEELWAYELGAKATTFDGRLRTNAALFYYDYSNLQVSKVQNRTIIVENAAEAELYGAELELTARLPKGFQVDGAASWLHSEYKDFQSQDPGDFNPFDPGYVPPVLDLSGNRLYQAPEVTANLGVEYQRPFAGGTLSLRGEADYVSRDYYTAFNSNILSQPANTKYNAFLTYAGPGDRWSATLYGRNLTDETTRANGLMGAIDYGGPAVGGMTPPRTYGLQFLFHPG